MPADGYLARKDYGNAVAGDVNADYSSGQASGALQSLIENYGSGNAMFGAHSWTGDAVFKAWRQGGATWTFGLKGSDDNFHLSRSGSLGSNDVLVADANKLSFKLPPLLPSTTVAAAPSAATAGAGAAIYVSDGDSGSPCLAVSDGTTWRRIALGAAISAT